MQIRCYRIKICEWVNLTKMSEPYNSEVMKWHSCLEKTQEKIWKTFNFIKSLNYSYCYLYTFLWMFICILRCIYLVVASSFQYFLGMAKPKRAFVWVMFCTVLCSVMMLTKLVYLGLNLDLRTPVCVFILRRQIMCNRLTYHLTCKRKLCLKARRVFSGAAKRKSARVTACYYLCSVLLACVCMIRCLKGPIMPRLCPGDVCCLAPYLFGCDGAGQGDVGRLREEDFLETSSSNSGRTTGERQIIGSSIFSEVWDTGFCLFLMCVRLLCCAVCVCGFVRLRKTSNKHSRWCLFVNVKTQNARVRKTEKQV